MARVRVSDLTKSFGQNKVLDRINFEIPEGSLVSLLGPSGCGKTTSLRLIAGFEEPDSGEIYIGDERVNDLKVNQRNIGMVFQSYALFPHMTVWDNIAYGLEQRKLSKEEIQSKVEAIIKLVHLEGFEKRKPKQLSGGQQQRVALARALVIEPRILLLDESLSALDKNLRVEMQVELRRILDASKITALFVTHDQEEALTLSDYIAVMDKGKIIQMGSPDEVYEFPKNRFVASFLGKTNFIGGKVLAHGEQGLTLDTELGEIKLPCREKKAIGRSALYGIRPEKVFLNVQREADTVLEGRVDFVSYAGNSTTYTVDCQGLKLIVERQNTRDEKRLKEGDQVFLSWEADHCLLMEDEV